MAAPLFEFSAPPGTPPASEDGSPSSNAHAVACCPSALLRGGELPSRALDFSAFPARGLVALLPAPPTCPSFSGLPTNLSESSELCFKPPRSPRLGLVRTHPEGWCSTQDLGAPNVLAIVSEAKASRRCTDRPAIAFCRSSLIDAPKSINSATKTSHEDRRPPSPLSKLASSRKTQLPRTETTSVYFRQSALHPSGCPEGPPSMAQRRSPEAARHRKPLLTAPKSCSSRNPTTARGQPRIVLTTADLDRNQDP